MYIFLTSVAWIRKFFIVDSQAANDLYSFSPLFVFWLTLIRSVTVKSSSSEKRTHFNIVLKKLY